MYFIILTAITMKRQIKHMIKYKYIPFDLGKKTYTWIKVNIRAVLREEKLYHLIHKYSYSKI